MVNNKLDFLMKLTNSHNAMLAKAVNFDTSYISRMRSGGRRIPKKAPFLKLLSSYFAGIVVYDYQKKILSDTVCPDSPWPDNKDAAAELLFEWLASDSSDAYLPDSSFASESEAESPEAARTIPAGARRHQERVSSSVRSAEIFYGDKGKRRAFLFFLEDLLSVELPGQLLLYSDESMSWLEENDIFMAQCTGLILELFNKGWKMKMIHTVTRNSSDMMTALDKWIPLYMSAAIEPYYYPRLRDNIYHRTLFIAGGHSALSSTSIGDHTEHALNTLLFDSEAVNGLEMEFGNYFRHCKPLADTYSASAPIRFLNAADKHDSGTHNRILAASLPSCMTMPEDTAASVCVQVGGDCLRYQQKKAAYFKEALDAGYQITEILNLPGIDSFGYDEGPLIPLQDLFGKSGIRYTRQEFAGHLMNILSLMGKYDNYRPVLSSSIALNAVVSLKEGDECFLIRASAPSLAFSVSEPRMVTAFFSYLEAVIQDSDGRDASVKALEDYITQLMR